MLKRLSLLVVYLPIWKGEDKYFVYCPGFAGGDRTSIELPQVQRDILKALKAAGKKVVFVNCSGSAVALVPELESCDAILQAWYPGQAGGLAVADVLFGDFNPQWQVARDVLQEHGAASRF